MNNVVTSSSFSFPLRIALVIFIFGCVIWSFLNLFQMRATQKIADEILATTEAKVSAEQQRQLALEATLTHVESDQYIYDVMRNDNSRYLPQEQLFKIDLIENNPDEPLSVNPTPDPIVDARPWQTWWRLLTDLPQPRP